MCIWTIYCTALFWMTFLSAFHSGSNITGSTAGQLRSLCWSLLYSLLALGIMLTNQMWQSISLEGQALGRKEAKQTRLERAGNVNKLSRLFW